MRNFQILIISAVNICKQCRETASASERGRRKSSRPPGLQPPNENSWTPPLTNKMLMYTRSISCLVVSLFMCAAVASIFDGEREGTVLRLLCGLGEPSDGCLSIYEVQTSLGKRRQIRRQGLGQRNVERHDRRTYKRGQLVQL